MMETYLFEEKKNGNFTGFEITVNDPMGMQAFHATSNVKRKTDGHTSLQTCRSQV